MAVGATFVIISGGIDLSVGAIYALASVLGALTLHIYGPGGIHPEHSGAGVLSGAAVCLGAALLAGLANGAMLVLLRVHPFIVTLGTMAIFRGIAFVITQGQSVGGFPPAFQNAVRWQIGDRLMPVPLLVMMVVAGIGWPLVFLAGLAMNLLLVVEWWRVSFGELDLPHTIRHGLWGTTGMVLGAQTAFAGLFLGLMDQCDSHTGTRATVA